VLSPPTITSSRPCVAPPRVRNYHVAVKEWNDEIIFLHKVRPGGTDRFLRYPGRAARRSARGRHRAAREILADLSQNGRAPVSAERPGRLESPQLGTLPAAPDPC